MILSAHMLVGAVIGSKVKNYGAIFILAVASHFILDAIPHWEYAAQFIDATNYDFLIITFKALIDLFIGASIVQFILRSADLLRPAFAGVFFSLLPDGLNYIYFLLKLTFGWDTIPLSYFMLFHNKIHFTDGIDLFFWRIAGEAIVIVCSLFILWSVRRARKGHE